MAFSTFRGMMAASNVSVGPIINTDTITTEVGVLIQYQSSLNNWLINSITAVDQDSTTLMMYGLNLDHKSSGSYYTYQPIIQSAGPSLSIASPLINSTASVSYPIAALDIDYNSTQGTVIVDADADGTSLNLNWVNSGNSALADNVTHSSGGTISTARVNAVNGSTKAVVLSLLTSGSSTVQLFDQSGATYDSSAAGPSDITKNMSIINLTSTLGVIIYNNSSNLIKLATYNISGTTISVDSATSSSLTAASGAKAVKIDSSHILFVYKNASNTLGAVVVNVATGSSFTFNTTYTSTATGITDDPIGHPGQFTGADYGVTWRNTNGQGCCTLMTVSGTSISLSTTQIYHTANNVATTTDYYSSYFMGMSSTQAGIAYLLNTTNPAGTSFTYATRAVVVDLNYSKTSNLWNTTFAGNIWNSSLSGIGTAGCIDACSIGTNKVFYISNTNSTTMTATTIDVDYSSAVYGTQFTFTTSATLKTVCATPIGFTGTNYLVLIAYNNGSTTSNAVIAEVSASGAVSFGSAVNVDTNAVGVNQPYTILALNYASTSTLIVNAEANNLYASIATNSGTTISSVTTPFNIFTSSSPTLVSIQGVVIDTTHVLLTFNVDDGNAYAQILSFSGSTITAGTAVTLTSTAQDATNNAVCILAPGNGVFAYNTASGTISGAPFSYSGTTITLGSQITIDSSGTASLGGGPSFKTALQALNSQEALLTYNSGGSPILKNIVLTSTSGTNLSKGTSYSSGNVSIPSSGQFTVSLDSYSQSVQIYTNANTGNVGMAMSYRV